MLRSTRTRRGRTESNILWNYGHTTIPRHLRDIFVTEYGIADLRGKSDEQCVLAMLAVTDARFQDELAARARAAGKLRADFVVPDAWRGNTPERLATALAPLRARGLFGVFPFGSDFSSDELRLLPALKRLQQVSASKATLVPFLLGSLAGRPSAQSAPLLERLDLARPRSVAEWLTRKLLIRALDQSATH